MTKETLTDKFLFKIMPILIGIVAVVSVLTSLTATLFHATGNYSESGLPLSSVMSYSLIGTLITGAVFFAIFKTIKNKSK